MLQEKSHCESVKICNYCYRIKLLYNLQYFQQETELKKKALPGVKDDFKDYNTSQQEVSKLSHFANCVLEIQNSYSLYLKGTRRSASLSNIQSPNRITVNSSERSRNGNGTALRWKYTVCSLTQQLQYPFYMISEIHILPQTFTLRRL